jgi:hypothetical protein
MWEELTKESAIGLAGGEIGKIVSPGRCHGLNRGTIILVVSVPGQATDYSYDNYCDPYPMPGL